MEKKAANSNNVETATEGGGGGGGEKTLFPSVLWAQRKGMVMMRIQIKTLEKPDFKIGEEYMSFKCLGEGVSGRNVYSFELPFYEPVRVDSCQFHDKEMEIEIRVLKKEAREWPKLHSAFQRPHWIKLDFQHWAGEEDSEEEEEMDPSKAQRDRFESILREETKKAKEMMDWVNKIKATTRMVYLFAYNILQFIGFTCVVAILLFSVITNGTNGIYEAYERAGPILGLCQCFALLEIIHVMVGIVKSGLMATTLQVLGRFFILFVVLYPAEDTHHHPVVFFLFLMWSLIELVRYPYYALSVLGVEPELLTWLRYSSWIPLYPLGLTCEATVTWLSIPYFEKTGRFSFPLPNALNFSVDPPTIFRVVSYVVVPIFAYTLISHMYGLRKKKISKKKIV